MPLLQGSQHDCQEEFLPPEADIEACTGAKPAAASPVTSRGYATWMPGRLKKPVSVLMIKPINLFEETTLYSHFVLVVVMYVLELPL